MASLLRSSLSLLLPLSVVIVSHAQEAKPSPAQASAPTPTPTPQPTVVPVEGFSVPDGFEITLWAQAPQLRNPTNIDVDAQGRIWVAEGANYRRHENRDKAGDRIMVLEDTDGDGRPDQWGSN